MEDIVVAGPSGAKVELQECVLEYDLCLFSDEP